METKHTPGPWEFRKWDGEEWPEKRWSVGQKINNGSAICISPRFFTDGEESEANAKLIASAPELLEALKYARRFVRDCDLDFIDNAIKKATL